MTELPAKLVILDAYPDKAGYQPGEAVPILVEVRNDGVAPFAGRLEGTLVHLAAPVAHAQAAVRLAPGGRSRLALGFQLPSDDFRGYGVDLRVVNQSVD
jgi:hypothetical protein